MKTKSVFLKYFAVIFLSAILGASCANTKLDSKWDSAAFGRFSAGKVLIAGLSDNTERRVMFEKTLAEEFNKKGVEALPSYPLISNAEHPDKDAVIAEARKQGMDYALTTRIVEIGMEEITFPANDPLLIGYVSPDRNEYGQIEKYLKTERVKQHHVKLESCLYKTETGELIWTGVSDTIKPGSKVTEKDVLASVTGVISDELILLSRNF